LCPALSKIFWVSQNICDLNRATFESDPARYGSAIRRDRIFLQPFDLLRTHVLAGSEVITVTV